jgi:hypothetical protein
MMSSFDESDDAIAATIHARWSATCTRTACRTAAEKIFYICREDEVEDGARTGAVRRSDAQNR